MKLGCWLEDLDYIVTGTDEQPFDEYKVGIVRCLFAAGHTDMQPEVSFIMHFNFYAYGEAIVRVIP